MQNHEEKLFKKLLILKVEKGHQGKKFSGHGQRPRQRNNPKISFLTKVTWWEYSLSTFQILQNCYFVTWYLIGKCENLMKQGSRYSRDLSHPRYSRNYNESLRNSQVLSRPSCSKVPKDSKRFQKILKDSKRFRKIPKDSKRLQKITKDY